MSLEGKASASSSGSVPVQPGPGVASAHLPALSLPLNPAKTGDAVRCVCTWPAGPGPVRASPPCWHRDKARLLLAEALALAAAEVPGSHPSARAVDLEKAILAQNTSVNPRYKAKLRSLAFNLKDANNPDLRRRVLAGEISGACACCSPCTCSCP